MPSYDYKCLSCQKRFTVRMTIAEHDKHKVKCPKCGSQKLEQQVQSFFAITSKKS